NLDGQIQPVQPQVHAEHILLATEDGAKQARDEITSGKKSFETVAKEESTDTTTAPNGGDLGWFPRGVMVKEFEDTAFNLQPGDISQPVHSKFGWHIIKVLEKDDNRPLTIQMLQNLKDGAFQKWLDDQKAASKITTTLPATPTPAPSPFEAPPGAPPTPVPTPLPTPNATPGTPPPAGTPTTAP
ncbi:MAG: peptidylprolyl isomerase, partial [Thermomicrobiales bacterium]